MNVKRFFAHSSREALAMVRGALGPDAVILSNKSLDGGCEILAVGGNEMDALVSGGDQQAVSRQPLLAEASPFIKSNRPVTHTAAMKMAPPKVERTSSSRPKKEWLDYAERDDEPVNMRLAEPQSLADFISKNSRPRDTVVVDIPVTESLPQITREPVKAEIALDTKAPEQPLPSMQAPQTMQEMAHIMNEMRTMRGVIESQLSELVWENIQRRDPIKSDILRSMLTAGFGAGLARQMAEKLPANHSQKSAINWAKSILENNLDTIPNESEILDKGGIFALIGPTGVGKTTTTAKLAARYVMKHGTNKLALITTDAYRIGGHEQLRIYGKILGVMVHAVKDEADLKIALEELKGKHTILIDTVGVNQRDGMVEKQIGMLSGADTNVQRLLCLAATSTGETLTDVVKAYKGKGLAGCIMTKLDEAATIGSVLDVVLREKLKLYYVANGQRVPEDLHLANAKFLIHHAFKLNQRVAAHAEFRDEELPLLMAHAAKMTNASSTRELNLG